MSDTGMEILAQSQRWHIDGTFKKCPKLLKQLLTFHAQYKNELFSCAYCVLPDKTTETYAIVFNKLKEIISEKHVLNVQKIMVDFESAMMNQLKITFEVAIKGCWFHYNQAIMRKLFNLGRTTILFFCIIFN